MVNQTIIPQPSTETPALPARNRARTILVICLVLGTALIYYFSNRDHHHWFGDADYPWYRGYSSPYDYTLRIAEALLHGHTGLDEHPGQWLNELVPFKGHFYSVFPLGAVLCMIPVALLRMAGMIKDFPSGAIVAVQAGASVFFFFQLSGLYSDKLSRRVMLALFPLFATWTWANLCFGGAWQIALGFALMGQAGALYFTFVNRRPLLAGLFFAIAFGNRTEVMLTAPFFLYFLLRPTSATENAREQLAYDIKRKEKEMTSRERRLAEKQEVPGRLAYALKSQAWGAVRFLLVPFILGVCTLAYNQARFGSITDFGYARIPGVLLEPWYQHGIFSLYSIPGNAEAMLLNTWKRVHGYPYLTPGGFDGSIFLSCPLLFLLFRPGTRDRDRAIKWGSCFAIAVLTFLLWIHGNAGGWQYSYRYAMVLLPWIFMLMLQDGPPRWAWIEKVLFVISVVINFWAMYLFLWTDYVQP